MSIQQVHTKRLGRPYSACRHESEHTLKYFKNYTKGQCNFECVMRDIYDECKCLPGYLNINNEAPSCSLSAHAQCVAPAIKMFNYEHCKCIQACSERIPAGQLIQYGNYKDAAYILHKSKRKLETMSAAVIYLPDVNEITHNEVADYSKH